MEGIDNGYYEYCVQNGFSLPVNRSDYVCRHTQIKHNCNGCGKIYLKSPSKAMRLNYRGFCVACTLEIVAEEKAERTRVQFLKDLALSDSGTEYVSNYTRQTELAVFACGICSENFERKPTKVVGAGQYYCLNCSSNSRAQSQSLSIDEHDQRMVDWGFKSKRLFAIIPNNRTELPYECDCGRKFKRTTAYMFKSGALGVCGACKKAIMKERSSFSSGDYDGLLMERRPKIKRLGEYLGFFVPTQHICSCGNTSWFPRPSNVLNSGNSCGDCTKTSRSERVIRQIFEKIFRKPFPNIRPDFLRNNLTDCLLEYDGYNRELSLAFEHHGSQHERFNKHYHPKGLESLKEIQERDRIKAELSRENNITLIVIASIEDRLPKLYRSEEYFHCFYEELLELLRSHGVDIFGAPKKIKIDWDKVAFSK